ncbi:hypothetical protein RvY_02041 [Ramazzottius varieornatus]|uniref:Uncharacterized protein n=1 Tax=Ramazzottius varieornatus TaxID=947166 RepID=A0A1D1UID2_RAMVA|nr:hypothetical protein RvY_02041 [Ramazzottius varieornatus]
MHYSEASYSCKPKAEGKFYFEGKSGHLGQNRPGVKAPIGDIADMYGVTYQAIVLMRNRKDEIRAGHVIL